MNIFDCHIHMNNADVSPDEFLKRLTVGGVGRAILFSHHPSSFTVHDWSPADDSAAARLSDIMKWADFSDRIIPFFWIDPLEGDAFEQADRAVEAGIAGFKVICNRFYPCDERPMKLWAHIAKKNKPILFHSGILYVKGPSSAYNRPVNFEQLIDVPDLRFALAHVSWPWCDECLAVYGHWQSEKHSDRSTAEMFLDTTPGTPKIYRTELFKKIYGIGFDIEDNIIFGTDCVRDYNVDYLGKILEMDKEALDAAGVSDARREKYYNKNLLRFLGE